MKILFVFVSCILFHVTVQCQKPGEAWNEKIVEANMKWQQSFNDDINRLGKLYHPDAIILTESGVSGDKSESVTAYHKKFKKRFEEVIDISSMNIVQGNHEIFYELGSFTTAKNIVFKNLII
jgi:hypothetical protein